jgi:hypothetical protein
MTSGRIAYKTPFLSLNFGLSSKDLFFKTRSGESHLLLQANHILRSSDQADAYRCEECGAVLIVGGDGKRPSKPGGTEGV